MQPHEPDGGALQVRPRGELGARLDPPHQGAAVKRAVEVQLSCADGLDLVNVGEMRVPPSFRRGAVEGELERSRKQLQQLADEQGILRPRRGRNVQIRELAGEHLLAEFAPDASFAKARHLRRRLRLELRDRQRLAFLVEGYERHVSGQRAGWRHLIGRPVPHGDRYADAACRREGNGPGHRDALAHPDRLLQLHPVHRCGDDRPATMAGRRQHADHIHPLQDLAGADVAVLVRDLRRHPLVQVHFGAGTYLLFVFDHRSSAWWFSAGGAACKCGTSARPSDGETWSLRAATITTAQAVCAYIFV